MKVENTANRVTVQAFTDGYPIHVRLLVDGDEVPNSLDSDDLHDLIYVAQRTLAQLEQTR